MSDQELKDVVNKHSAALRKLNEVLKDYRTRLQNLEIENKNLRGQVHKLQEANPDIGQIFQDILKKK